MRNLRALLIQRRGWFTLLVACALAVRLIVPAGFMPAGGGHVALQLCPGAVAVPAAAMPGMHHGKSDGGGHGKTEMPCSFAGIGLATLGSSGATILFAAALFALLLASRVVSRTHPGEPSRLRPPLRAPPVTV